jgi:Na+-transporting methylmalonyl-CoA/oxaloacetate decarboxylase gamma subunit
MTTVPISVDLQELLDLPDCSLLSLPKKSKMSIFLPNGAELPAFTDISKGAPTDCSLSFSLILQLAPFLASIECLLKVLSLLKPLIDIIGSVSKLQMPPLSAVSDFTAAGVGVTECITDMLIPGKGLLSCVKSVLILILSFLKCFVTGMSSVVNNLLKISVQMDQAAGNDELQRVLKCAQDNAMASADHLQGAIAPVFNILALVKPLLDLAQIKVEIPTIEPGADLDGLRKALAALQNVVTVLEEIVQAPPLSAFPPPYPDTGA